MIDNTKDLVKMVKRAVVADKYLESRTSDCKPSNPKDVAGESRIPLDLIPDGPLAHIAIAFHEGATKYGKYNWRGVGVRASVYIKACRRHIGKWWNGDSQDPKTRVHHLANATACLLILLDCEINSNLDDDRPPKQDLEGLYSELESVLAHLNEMHKDKSPKHYTERNKND